MPIETKPYIEQHTLAVTAFNRRLRHNGIRFQFPERHVPEWLPRVEGRNIYQEFYLAVEDEQVRGGYILKHQEFLLNGVRQSIGNYQLPLSEGIIDSTYARVGVQLLSDAQRRSPMMYALGMGGTERPLPQLLSAVGWKLISVPFHFFVRHPQSFLKNIAALRERPAWRLMSTVAAATGVGYIGILSLQASRRKKRSRLGRLESEPVERFENWANEIWQRCGDAYSLCAVRNKPVLNILYPPENKRFIRLRVSIDGEAVGWAVMLDTQMKKHKQFGDMQVGSIVDCLAPPDQADAVIAAATAFLEQRGVDLVVSNQLHPWWCSALANSGFLSGPSNFALALSPRLVREIEPADPSFEKIHMNRGDGDGPIHL